MDYPLQSTLVAGVILLLSLQVLLAGRTWLWEFSTVLPWYVWGVVLMTGLVVAVWRKWIVVILILIVFAPYILTISDVGSPKALEFDGQEYSVFSWNTQFWVAPYPESDILDFISRHKSDVIHLQEVMHYYGPDDYRMVDVVDSIRSVLGDQYSVLQHREFITATKFEVVDSFEYDWFYRVDVDIDDNLVSLYNVHIPVHVNPRLIANPLKLLTDTRERFYTRLQTSAELLADLESNPNRKIISGDFNTQTSMPLIHPYLRSFNEAFRDTRAGIQSSIKLAGMKAWRIDYIFGEGIAFKKAAEVDPEFLSDHWGQKTLFGLTHLEI